MRRIKNYEDFTNEEINWKKGLATAAIGASLLTTPGCEPSEAEKYYARKNKEYQDSLDYEDHMSDLVYKTENSRKDNVRSATLPLMILNKPKGFSVEAPKTITVFYTNYGQPGSDEYKFISIVDQNINKIIDTVYIDLSEELSNKFYGGYKFDLSSERDIKNWDKNRNLAEYKFIIEPKIKTKFDNKSSIQDVGISDFFKDLYQNIKTYDIEISSNNYFVGAASLSQMDLTPGLDRIEICDENGNLSQTTTKIEIRIIKQ